MPSLRLFSNQLIHTTMTQDSFVSHLTTRGWDENAARRLFESSIVDDTLSLDEWRKSLVGAFCSRNKSLGALYNLSKFLGKDVPEWDDLTKPNVSEYKDYLLNAVARNSAVTYLHQLSGVMNIYEDVLPSANYRSVMQVRNEPSQHVALSEEEVERIHRYMPRSKVEADIKRAFMLECLCGARSCDIASLSESNIHDGWLTYISQKTKTETSVPVHRYLREYLAMPTSKPKYQRAVVCETIKRICRRCGIDGIVKIFTKGQWVTKAKWSLVGSHTARRSFATQLALRGVPVPTISKLMGHSNTKMTSRYICIENKDIGDTALAFFS